MKASKAAALTKIYDRAGKNKGLLTTVLCDIKHQAMLGRNSLYIDEHELYKLEGILQDLGYKVDIAESTVEW